MTDAIDELFDGHGATMSVSEAAQALGMTKQGIYYWLRDGILPGYKVGTTWFIVTSELKDTLRQGKNTPKEK